MSLILKANKKDPAPKSLEWRSSESWSGEESKERKRVAFESRSKGEASPLDPPGVLKAIVGLAMAIDGLDAFIRDQSLPGRRGHADDCFCVSCRMGSDPAGMLWMIQHLHGILANDVITHVPCMSEHFEFPDINELLRMFGGEERATA